MLSSNSKSRNGEMTLSMLTRSSSGSSASSRGSGVVTSLSHLSTYLVLYLFFSAQVLPRTSAAQKFYPNGRYGRRSDLPPLLHSMSNADKFAPTSRAEAVFGPDLLLGKDPVSYPEMKLIEEYLPMWCAEVDQKRNLYRCFDRFPLKLLRQPSEFSIGTTNGLSRASQSQTSGQEQQELQQQ